MAKSQETFSKKEREKKRLRRRQDKEQRREERKNAPETETSFEDMLAYVDEYGNITDTPPDPTKKKVIKAENIEIGVPKQEAPDPSDLIRTGVITFFNNDKGYGFIKDLESQASVFVHVNGLIDSVSENDKVTFETEKGLKGPNAVQVKLVQ
jgi:cold shock CspA family protein